MHNTGDLVLGRYGSRNKAFSITVFDPATEEWELESLTWMRREYALGLAAGGNISFLHPEDDPGETVDPLRLIAVKDGTGGRMRWSIQTTGSDPRQIGRTTKRGVDLMSKAGLLTIAPAQAAAPAGAARLN